MPLIGIFTGVAVGSKGAMIMLTLGTFGVAANKKRIWQQSNGIIVRSLSRF